MYSNMSAQGGSALGGKVKIIILFLFIALFTSGCSISFKSAGGGGGTDGGVYISNNQGDTWKQVAFIPTITGRPQSIAALNTETLVMDPGDNKAIYFGSAETGLYYSYNMGVEWQQAKNLKGNIIRAVAVDPSSKCIIYASLNNKVFKSTDCNRTWSQVFYDDNQATMINSIIVDHYDSAIVYIATSRGEIIKSLDRGLSWQTVGRFKDNVTKVVISPFDSRMLFAITDKKGLFRSFDSGLNWENLEKKLELTKNQLSYNDLTLSASKNGMVILATNYGMLKSEDNGDNWTMINLITPDKGAVINTVATSPKNEKEIYYATNTTFYRSIDGGENWTTKKLPTTRAGWKILIDPEDPKIIYLGVKRLQ